ncbi:MAG TPA: hypothetical protein VNY30_02080 [Bryobacteraceae bacterium]|jgi:hypothetical protein|nr:hypothetical protein [Bryobacteraceae bacterium]
MSYLEDDLKMALRRTEPPEGFADRVLARANGPAPAEPSWWEYLMVLVRPPRVQWVALSLILSVMIPAAGVYRKERQERAEGERAKEQLVFAVHVAGNKLHRVQQKVLEMGRMDTRL